jgi:hypothetical protein
MIHLHHGLGEEHFAHSTAEPANLSHIVGQSGAPEVIKNSFLMSSVLW